MRIVLPLSVPGLVAGGLFAFIMTWNNFLFAFLFTTTTGVKTLPVMMRLFALGEPAVWGVSAAGAMLTTLPVALLFLLFQRMLMSGLAAGRREGMTADTKPAVTDDQRLPEEVSVKDQAISRRQALRTIGAAGLAAGGATSARPARAGPDLAPAVAGR